MANDDRLIWVYDSFSASESVPLGRLYVNTICPAHARKVSGIMTALAGAAIKKACSEPKRNELFI